MARRTIEPKTTTVTNTSEERFVELMLVAADFVRNCGGVDQAKKSLTDAGQFIEQAGSLANANKALDVLENLRSKIVE